MPFSPELRKVTAITASTYTVRPHEHRTLFTNRGGGALTLTLPPIANVQAGWEIYIFQVAAGDLVITAPANKLTTYNNATATTFTAGTNGEEIGNGYHIIYDGSTYLLFFSAGAEAITTVVA